MLINQFSQMMRKLLFFLIAFFEQTQNSSDSCIVYKINTCDGLRNANRNWCFTFYVINLAALNWFLSQSLISTYSVYFLVYILLIFFLTLTSLYHTKDAQCKHCTSSSTVHRIMSKWLPFLLSKCIRNVPLSQFRRKFWKILDVYAI